MGARPENQPTESRSIQPYAAEEFPEMFQSPSWNLTVLSAKRTFWEKATILHDIFHRSEGYRTADRISRHYYDLFRLVNAGVAQEALNDIALLESVVRNKQSYFYRAGAKYQEALLGQLRLVPDQARLNALERDYEKMRSMFFVDPPKFDEIISTLLELEGEINRTV
ncbi:MAG: nucleotidyl transferase AbiEii/AbiGii toxin family protein [Pyrinomonadaceae bacterium]